jgi:hypothetical protein
LALCAVLYHISVMVLYRMLCTLEQQSLVTVLRRCDLPLPVYVLADEKHSHYLTEQMYLPTIVCGRASWHLGYTTAASAAAFIAVCLVVSIFSARCVGMAVTGIRANVRVVAGHGAEMGRQSTPGSPPLIDRELFGLDDFVLVATRWLSSSPNRTLIPR